MKDNSMKYCLLTGICALREVEYILIYENAHSGRKDMFFTVNARTQMPLQHMDQFQLSVPVGRDIRFRKLNGVTYSSKQPPIIPDLWVEEKSAAGSNNFKIAAMHYYSAMKRSVY